MVQGKLENKKIGVLGGSFDPAHNGHVRISKLAKKNYDLSQVIWAITKQNPFKKNNPNDIDEYSVKKPATNVASSSGKSNGSLFVSANAEIINITNIGNSGMANHIFF